MFKNYLVIAWRNLLQNKTFSFINIFGLSVGLATCFIIMLYVFDETSYDKHQKDLEQIYRVSIKSETGQDLGQWAGTPAPLAQTIKSDFGEVEQTTRILNFQAFEKMFLRNEETNQVFLETNGYYADASFFEIFTYEFKYGNKASALEGPNTMVISEDIANKLFGNQNPIDRLIIVEGPNGKLEYTVKGVFKNLGHKSHLKANYLLSMNNNGIGQWVSSLTSWAYNNIFHAYIKLNKEADVSSFEEKLPAFLDQHGGKDLKEMNLSKSLFLQPLKDIYLTSDIGYEVSANGSIIYIYIFSSIALFLLLIACINFMNLSTARSEKRAREVGVRKVMGAQKIALVWQFLGESLMMALIAFLFSLIIAGLFLPLINSIVQKELSLFQKPILVFWMLGLTIITGFIAGLYPSVFLSSFKAVVTLKGKLLNSLSAVAIRKGLVIFQFAISISLILVAMVIWQQLHYIKNKDLGFDKEQKVVIPFQNTSSAQNYTALKNVLLQNPGIISASAGTSYPGIQLIEDMLFYPADKPTDEFVDIHLVNAANDYIETLGYEMLNGRIFSQNDSTDLNSIILNETAIKQLGYDKNEAIGKSIYFDMGEKTFLTIIGVVRDFNYKSLHENITPYGILKLDNRLPRYFITNIQKDNVKGTLSDIQEAWNKINPDIPFTYSFLDQDFQKNYEREERTSSIIVAFTIVAIFIACLGLFGLASFTAEQRKKEVGVRKVLGASVTSVTALLSKDFLKLVVLAILISGPIAWFLGNRWLEDFAYHIDMSWWTFLLAGVVAILIALITISFQSIKAALSNPVNSLRNE